MQRPANVHTKTTFSVLVASDTVHRYLVWHVHIKNNACKNDHNDYTVTRDVDSVHFINFLRRFLRYLWCDHTHYNVGTQ